MRGSIYERSKGSWRITLEFGYGRDPKTGKRRRIQKFASFRGTKRQAQDRVNELLVGAGRGEYVDASRLTLGAWLMTWLETILKPRRRPATYIRYKGIIDNYLLKADIAGIPLQQLRPSHIEAYYANLGVSASTVTLHHAILHSALRKALKDRLVTLNVAADLDGKPRRSHDREDARKHAWMANEARDFLAAAQAAGSQPAALYALALDTGMRKGELCGLQWSDIDVAAGKVRVVRQLLKPGPKLVYGPTKTGRVRTISIAAETVKLLRAHKQHQARLKMLNRTVYADHGLIFAKEWEDMTRNGVTLGHPLQMNNLGQREYARLIKVAGVRPIKFHGLRHTCASLLLQAGTPVHVVAERLGHAKVSMTMETYAHVLPGMQEDAARTLGGLLYGR